VPAYPEGDPSSIHLELEALPQGAPLADVVRQLIGLLSSGALVRGSRLPPERQLAATLGVGRSAVREALAALEILGIVTVRPGSGTYFQDTASELLPTTLSWGLMLAASRTDDLIEVRSALEVQAASLAAQRATSTHIDAMRAYVTTMKESTHDVDAFIDADIRFHLELANSARNTVLQDLLQNIRSLLRLWVERGLSTPAQAEKACDEHQAILDAIQAGDPAAAETAMSKHMLTATHRLHESS
jgi:GntR family transcriptional repressor for pyruvate dehydrogenase complex